jgi:hypothetical protein
MSNSVEPGGRSELIERLTSEKHSLQTALMASHEYGDSLQEQLGRLSASLTAEVRERQASEEKLQKLVQSVTEEKGDGRRKSAHRRSYPGRQPAPIRRLFATGVGPPR